MSEPTPDLYEPLPALGGAPIGTSNLAATLEVVYLQDTLTALGTTHRCAIDVGAHRGDVTDALTELGFRVLAVEPQPLMADRLQQRFRPLIDLSLVKVERSAASNRRDKASLIIGSASTVTTLETSWTQIAFPEEFQNARRIDVPLRPLSDMMRDGFESPAFVKIDVEGHELPALAGLFAPDSDGQRMSAPPVVMFEANQRFPDAARDCIRLLAQQGYSGFDVFIRDGVAPIAASRFSALGEGADPLPAEWFACGEKYFYANVIAYHESLPAELLPSHPVEFLQRYHLHAAREVLQRGSALEAGRPMAVHPIWSDARDTLRDYLMRDDWREFLKHPVCRNMFYRGKWSAAQDREVAAISDWAQGRSLLSRVRDPNLGGPRFNPQSPSLSTNMLGMLYYLMRVQSREPAMSVEGAASAASSFIEIGGGYGAFAWLYASENPKSAYTIIDLPEMLAIQHYYLSLALPAHRVRFVSRAEDAVAAPGEIVLLPASLLDDTVGESGATLGETLRCEQLFSTFGFSELPRELQRRIERTGYFGARRILLAGQLSSELPDLRLVAHSEVVGAAMQRFEQLSVERFHIGDNYLLLGSRAA